jgi:hypothetical protein
MTGGQFHVERVSSHKTEALFVSLVFLFLFLLAWRANGIGLDLLGIVFISLFVFFLFYSINYRTLTIQLNEDSLQLKFGIFAWVIQMDNIESCQLDTTSLWRIGGAGIHFTSLGGRYRAMFNFLEHPRVVIALKVKRGLVRDIAFSTRQPDEIIYRIEKQVLQRPKYGDHDRP